MDIELIALVAGVILSLLFSYVPGLDVKFGSLSGQVKRLVMLGVLVAAVLGIWGAGCAGLWGVCYPWRDVLRAFIMALIANQGTYLITPPTDRYIVANNAGWLSRYGKDNIDDDREADNPGEVA